MNIKGYVKTVVDKDNLVLLAEVKSVEQLQINNIECILADNIFTIVFFTDKKSLQVRRSLNDWESFLPKNIFVRVNRKTIVNLQHVKTVEKSTNQTLKLHMGNYEDPIIMSRSYISKLKGNLII